jgi:hypothetical protein
VLRRRRYLQAFFDVFGVDISAGAVVANTLTNHVEPLVRLRMVSAYQLATAPEDDGTEAFQVGFGLLEIEPVPQTVFAADFGLPGLRAIGSVQYGILRCHLTLAGSEKAIRVVPLVELLSDGKKDQYGECIGLSVKWDQDVGEWTLINRAGNTWLLGSLRNVILCEVKAKSSTQIWLRVEVAREDFLPVFDYNLEELSAAVSSSQRDLERITGRRAEYSELSAREKLIAQVLQQRLTPRRRYELAIMRMVLA